MLFIGTKKVECRQSGMPPEPSSTGININYILEDMYCI